MEKLEKLAKLCNTICLLLILQEEIDDIENLLDRDFKHELKRDTKALQKTLEKYIYMVYKANGGITDEAEAQLYKLHGLMRNAIIEHTRVNMI